MTKPVTPSRGRRTFTPFGVTPVTTAGSGGAEEAAVEQARPQVAPLAAGEVVDGARAGVEPARERAELLGVVGRGLAGERGADLAVDDQVGVAADRRGEVQYAPDASPRWETGRGRRWRGRSTRSPRRRAGRGPRRGPRRAAARWRPAAALTASASEGAGLDAAERGQVDPDGGGRGVQPRGALGVDTDVGAVQGGHLAGDQPRGDRLVRGDHQPLDEAVGGRVRFGLDGGELAVDDGGGQLRGGEQVLEGGAGVALGPEPARRLDGAAQDRATSPPARPASPRTAVLVPVEPRVDRAVGQLAHAR